MATFPSIQPTYGMRKTSAPRIRSTRLGDGYEFRALFGLPLTQDPKVYDLTFNVSETQSDVIEGFLRSRVNDQDSFTFTPPGEGFTKTGTYSQSSTTITITVANHRLFAGDSLVIDFTSGNAADGTYVVSSVTNANNFLVTAASGATTNGNVSITKSASYKFVCPEWNKVIDLPNLATITATFVQKFEP